MARRSFSIAAVAALCLAACVGLAACAGGTAERTGTQAGTQAGAERAAPPSEQDATALAALGGIATRDAAIDGDPTETECWAPTEHPVAGETGESFRVICRVHYEQQGNARYRDMICIGDLARDPVAESCYQWAFYTDMPKFEDHPAYLASAAS